MRDGKHNCNPFNWFHLWKLLPANNNEYCDYSLSIPHKQRKPKQKLSLPLKLQSYESHSNGIVTTKSHSTKRTLHIFDSIQSIFQSNHHHHHNNNHSFNDRHQNNHDKKHKHIPSNELSNAKHTTSKHSDSHKSKKDSIDSSRTGMKKNNSDPNDLDGDAISEESKMQNVIRILINSTNPRQSNGKYVCPNHKSIQFISLVSKTWISQSPIKAVQTEKLDNLNLLKFLSNVIDSMTRCVYVSCFFFHLFSTFLFSILFFR